MAINMSVLIPAPTGVLATYFGTAGGATAYYYFIQAIYPSGRSELAISNLITAIAALDRNNCILVQWNAMSGAIGYNVYRSTSTTLPTVGTIFLGSVTGNAITDIGTSLVAGNSGQVILDGVRFARGRYSFAVDGGGAPGLITLAQSDTIPKNAIIIGGVIRVSTALATATAVGVGTSAGSSATALVASTAIATLNTGGPSGITPLVPTNAVPVFMSAAGTLTITSTVAALTAGIIDIMVIYVQPLS